MRETRFSDVCGTIDELRKILSGELNDSEIKEAFNLLDDAIYMISRMTKRLHEYDASREELRSILKKMDEVKAADYEAAFKSAERLKEMISSRLLNERSLEKAVELAEKIRKIAGSLEGALRLYKEAYLDLIELYGGIKGLRDWGKDEEERLGVSLPILMPLENILKEAEPWLPPEPHRGKLIEFIKRGRAYIQPRKRGQPPLVYFEDGGAIPLHKVRYSERTIYRN